jgi:hypothetical protein
VPDQHSADEPHRRRFPRLLSQKVLLVRKLDDQADLEEFARTSTLGPGGCGFISADALGVGSTLEILISLGAEVVRSRARVVYERALKDQFDVGVEFLDLSREDRERIKHLFERAPVSSAPAE